MIRWPQWQTALVRSGAWAALADSAAKVAAVLAVHVSRETGDCQMTRETLARLAGVSIATVHRGISHLKQAGWLEVKSNGRRPATYVLHIPSSFTGEASKDGSSFTGEASTDSRSFTREASTSLEASLEASHEASPVMRHLKELTSEPVNQPATVDPHKLQQGDSPSPQPPSALVGLQNLNDQNNQNGHNLPGWMVTALRSAGFTSGFGEVGKEILQASQDARCGLSNAPDASSIAVRTIARISKHTASGAENPVAVFRSQFRRLLPDTTRRVAEYLAGEKRRSKEMQEVSQEAANPPEPEAPDKLLEVLQDPAVRDIRERLGLPLDRLVTKREEEEHEA